MASRKAAEGVGAEVAERCRRAVGRVAGDALEAAGRVVPVRGQRGAERRRVPARRRSRRAEGVPLPSFIRGARGCVVDTASSAALRIIRRIGVQGIDVGGERLAVMAREAELICRDLEQVRVRPARAQPTHRHIDAASDGRRRDRRRTVPVVLHAEVHRVAVGAHEIGARVVLTREGRVGQRG